MLRMPKGHTTMGALRACRIEWVPVSAPGKATKALKWPPAQVGSGTCAIRAPSHQTLGVGLTAQSQFARAHGLLAACIQAGA